MLLGSLRLIDGIKSGKKVKKAPSQKLRLGELSYRIFIRKFIITNHACPTVKLLYNTAYVTKKQDAF